MSKRVRVPAPFQKFVPSIVRGVLPRVILLVGLSAIVLCVGSGSYLLSHSTPVPHSPTQPKPTLTSNLTDKSAAKSASNTLGSSAAIAQPSSQTEVSANSDDSAQPAAQAGAATDPMQTTTPAKQASISTAAQPVTKTITDTVQNVRSLTNQRLGGL